MTRYFNFVPFCIHIRFKTILSYCAHCTWGAFVHICNVLQSEAWLGNNITHAPSAHLAQELDSKTWNSSNIRMHPQHRPGTGLNAELQRAEIVMETQTEFSFLASQRMKLDPECQELLIFFCWPRYFLLPGMAEISWLTLCAQAGSSIWLYCINKHDGQVSGQETHQGGALTTDRAPALMTSDGSLIAELTAEDLIMACLQDRVICQQNRTWHVCVFSPLGNPETGWKV